MSERDTNPLVTCGVRIEVVTRKPSPRSHLNDVRYETVTIQEGESGDEFAERVAEAVRELLP